MTRQKPLDQSTFTDEQRKEWERHLRRAQPDEQGYIGGPFDAWMLNGELSRRLRGLGDYIWERTSLDKGLVELAICVTAKFWESNVEWVSHAPKAVQFGIPQSVLDDVFAGNRPSGTPEQVLIYDASISLHTQHKLPRPLFDQFVQTFGEQGLMDLVATNGLYTIVSMTLNAFEVQAKGVTQPFQRER